MSRALVLSLCLLALPATDRAAAELPPAPHHLRDPSRVREWLESVLAAPFGPPSISIAVARDGEIVLAEAVGWADLEARLPATIDTRYRTYSISKGITAIAIMQLLEQGKIAYDHEIQRYVPELPRKRWPVRLEHLLSHTSGIRHYRSGAGEISSTTEYPTLAGSLAVFADAPLEFEPGTASRYTSFGFNLLTGVVEKVSGTSFEQYLETSVFAPAGMEATGLAVAGRESDRLARAYWRPRSESGVNWPIDELPNVSGRYGSSGVVSTPTDLVELFVALRQGRLLRAETVQKMYTPLFPEVDPDQAHGWNLERKDARLAVYRSGAGTGYSGALVHYPEQEVTGALLTNQNQFKERWPVLEVILGAFLAAEGSSG